VEFIKKSVGRRLPMDQKQATSEKEVITRFPVLYVAFELGNST
jgi:hypothetical protein